MSRAGVKTSSTFFWPIIDSTDSGDIYTGVPAKLATCSMPAPSMS